VLQYGMTLRTARALNESMSAVGKKGIKAHFFLGSSPRAGEDGKSS
jgi:hypothetical protein